MRNRTQRRWFFPAKLVVCPNGEFGEVALGFSEECRERAAECLRLAQKRSEPASRAMLLTMAEEWLKLAERHAAEEGKPN